MKKFLLLVCALPCLISAQNARMNIEPKEKASVQRLIKSLPTEQPNRVRTKDGAAKSLPSEKSNQLRPFAGAANILPDSVYAYYDEANTDLSSKSYFKYNEEGWPIEQIMVSYWMTYDWELDEYVKKGHEYKYVYEYTADKGFMTLKITSYYFWEGEWEIQSEAGIAEYIFFESDFRKFFTDQKSLDICLEVYIYGLNYYYYYDMTDDWIIPYSLKAVEFDAEGRPTVFDLIELTYDYDEDEIIEMVSRMEAGYNDKGLRNILSLFLPSGNPANPWMLDQTEDFFFNDDLLLTKVVITDSDGESKTFEYEYNSGGQLIKESQLYSYGWDIYEYKYDEQGNLCYMFNYWNFSYYDEDEEDSYGSDYEWFYVNYYPEGSANAIISAIQSVVYPNPVSDVLNVRIAGADNALITIVSLTGSKVFRQKTTQPVVSIPVQSLPKGFYFLTIQTGAQTKTHKIQIR